MRVVLWRLAAGLRRPLLVHVQFQRHSGGLAKRRPLRHCSMAAAAQPSADSAPVLDRDAFTEVLHVQALRIPARDCQRFMKLMTGWEPLPKEHAILWERMFACIPSIERY